MNAHKLTILIVVEIFYLSLLLSVFYKAYSELVHMYACTVKPVLSGHSKIDKAKILMANGCLMKVKSIAEWSPWSILQYF